METNQVTEHLQVIRTLMERSALYRRALAPIMIYCGLVGIVAGIAGWLLKIGSDQHFILFWSGAAALALGGSFFLVRRQALKDSEPFWSSPTRRVTQALLPPLVIGCFLNLTVAYMVRHYDWQAHLFFVVLWALFYGCAIHSAGFFMPRGMKLFGWIFILIGCALFVFAMDRNSSHTEQANLFMGVLFGGLHLAYGIYLYFTENRKTAP